MTQEEKQILLKDLCARLPYGVICNDSRHGDSRIIVIDVADKTVYCYDFDEYVELDKIKPYLRPMSSMTEEEKQECCSIFNGSMYQFEVNEYGDVESTKPTVERECIYYDAELMVEWMNWLNAHHFDYRGLIEKGLAIEAPDGMYDLKEK